MFEVESRGAMKNGEGRRGRGRGLYSAGFLIVRLAWTVTLDNGIVAP